MKVHYKAILKSDSPKLDNMQVRIGVGDKVTSKFRWVQPLCSNALGIETQWYNTEILSNLVND